MVTNMAENENHPPHQEKPDKKLRLDLSEAMPHGFDEDDDEIIELKDEISSPPEKPQADTDPDADFAEEDETSGLPAVEKIIDLDALEDDDSDPENVIRLSDDLAFEEEDEEADEFPPIEKEPVLKADGHNDVVEITEFDDILTKDTNEMVTLAEISEELELEEEDDDDEFLELIDVEEDGEAEIEEMKDEVIQFDEPGADMEDVELKDFINDSLDEEIQIVEDFEDDLISTLGVEAGEEINLAEETSKEEEFDFSMDSSEISKKIDQLDTIFYDDTEAESKLDEDAELDEETVGFSEPEFVDNIDEIETEDIGINDDEIKTEDVGFSGDEMEAEDIGLSGGEIEVEDIGLSEGGIEAEDVGRSEGEIEAEDVGLSGDEIEADDVGVSGGESIDVPLAVGGIAALDASHDQIEETIEQIIERKFSGKIESLITQIIEKAVSKEIKRLKQILLEDDRDEGL